MIPILLHLGFPRAEAFCGTFVGGAGSEFYNEYSQVAIVRDGTSTHLTVVNDVQGEFDDFALVIPVPEVLSEEDIHVLDPGIFTRLDAYSQPRLVRYECSDFEWEDEMDGDSDADSDGDSDADSDADSDVQIEAEYIIGEYEIVILSAEQSTGLFTWLNDNGYQIPAQSQDLLQEYLDGGSYFLAAKISSDAAILSGDMLSPLQFHYASGAFQIPIRIGTLNSKTEQDLIIYALNPYSSGSTAISNYDEFSIEDECMWDSEGEEFGTYYSEQFSEGYEAQGDAGWTLEYAWGGGGCDPCPGNPPNSTDLISLGIDEDYIHNGVYFFTRIHMRYTPQQVEEHGEVTLYHSNIHSQEQYRFIEYKWELEDRFPICGVGTPEEPGSCDGTPPPESDTDGDASGEGSNSGDGLRSPTCSGCTSAETGAGLSAWLIGLFAARRRK
jgi:hypothetical protein